MNIEAPVVARQLFSRLCKGDNLLLSLNGPSDDADLYRQVQADEQSYRDYFAVLGFRLQSGENCYYFTMQDEPTANLDSKLDRLIKLVRLLDFLSTHVDSFGEGVHFSAAVLESRCNGDSQAERFLREIGRGETNSDRLESLLQSLVRQGYLSEYDTSRKEYRVLSAINYLYEFADCIQINDSEIAEGNVNDDRT